MLIITFRSQGATEDIPWHVGERDKFIPAGMIDSIQADGDELDYIYRLLPELEQAGYVVKFTGDDSIRVTDAIKANLKGKAE